MTLICDQRHISDAEGRMGSVDNGIFIHAIVPMHVDAVALLAHAASAVSRLKEL